MPDIYSNFPCCCLFVDHFHMAPELLRTVEGKYVSGKPTVQSDVYSLGMVIYQVLFRTELYDTDIVPPEGAFCIHFILIYIFCCPGLARIGFSQLSIDKLSIIDSCGNTCSQ